MHTLRCFDCIQLPLQLCSELLSYDLFVVGTYTGGCGTPVIIGSWFSYRSIELRTYDMCKSYQFSDRFKLIKVAVPVINNVLLC